MMLIGRLLGLERKGLVAGPNYAVVGPWNHGDSHFLAHKPFDQRILDWYRHWLDDGPRPAWFGEPRITYCEMKQALNGECEWRRSNCWPPRGTKMHRWYLQPGGGLAEKRPPTAGASVGRWSWNPLAGTGETAFSKWDNAASVPQRDSDQALEDEWKGVTFSTPVLEDDLVVTGPIVLKLRASTVPLVEPDPGIDLGAIGAPLGLPGIGQLTPPYLDTDFVVKLADVGPNGNSTLIQSGFLRASRRALDPARTRVIDGEKAEPFPYHDEAHVLPVKAGRATTYWIEVWPTSKRFAKGHRLRIALYSADTANHLTLLKPVTNTVLAGSYLALPQPR
jgi:predicted acyl esterase